MGKLYDERVCEYVQVMSLTIPFTSYHSKGGWNVDITASFISFDKDMNPLGSEVSGSQKTPHYPLLRALDMPPDYFDIMDYTKKAWTDIMKWISEQSINLCGNPMTKEQIEEQIQAYKRQAIEESD